MVHVVLCIFRDRRSEDSESYLRPEKTELARSEAVEDSAAVSREVESLCSKCSLKKK